MKRIVMALVVLMVFASLPLSADVYIQQKSHTDAFMGQPAKDSVNTMWIGDDKFAMISDEMTIIINLPDQKMYWVNHANKSYVPMDLPLDLSKYFPPQLQQMMKGVSVEVKASGENKTIGKWKCDGYDVDMNIMMMTMKQKVWASTDVDFDWKAYNEKLMPQFTQALFRVGDEMVNEFLKIEGFQIRTEMSMDMMGQSMNQWSEVQEISKKSAPADVYSPPEGYTKKDKFEMGDMR